MKRNIKRELNQDNYYFIVNKHIVKEVGYLAAVLLGYLESIKHTVKSIEDENLTWYKVSDSFISLALGITKNTIYRYLEVLELNMFIETKTIRNCSGNSERYIGFTYSWDKVN